MTSTPDGPVEWVAITFLGTTLGAGVAAPLAELIDAKTVRLLDAAVVHKAADGIVTEGELAGTASAVAGKVAAAQEAGAAQDRTRMQTEVETQVADALRAEAAAAPAAPSVDDLYTQLTKLGELREMGLLTEAEFAEQKTRLLA